MLSINHPLLPIVMRLRSYVLDEQASQHDRDLYQLLLVRLENGMFERMPQIVIEAVCLLGGDMHTDLDQPLVDITREVALGLEVSSALIANFRLRLEHHHGSQTGKAKTIEWHNVIHLFTPPS